MYYLKAGVEVQEARPFHPRFGAHFFSCTTNWLAACDAN
jgi:hypothetical protein